MPSTKHASVIPQLSSPPTLSARGQRALIRPPLLRCSLFECQYNACCNHAGLLNLGVAENSLCLDFLADYFKKNFSLEYSDFTYGTALTGSLRLFAALRNLFDVYFNASQPVLPEHIVAGTGCSSVIDSLVSVLADAGEGILVAKPHYNGFVTSFRCRNEVLTIGVDVPAGKEALPESLDAFERKIEECKALGVNIRAIMLCNPHNPLGFCYPRETLLAYLRFAESHNIHLISDEIYALSVYDSDLPSPVPFTSVLALDPIAEAGCNPERVHVVYGPSKDFGVNGLRLGVVVTRSNAVHTAMESSALLMKISSASDALWSGLLLDSVALPHYLALNRSRLTSAYARATSFLKTHQISYRPAQAGHFVWVDLSRYLPTQDEEGKVLEDIVEREEMLVQKFLRHGVNLGRASAYSGQPGYFRLTFTLRPDYFECDGGQPACSNCTKMGRDDCSYQRVSAEENDEVKARKKMLKAQKEAGGGGGGGGALGSRRRWNRKLDLGRSTRRRRTTTPSTRSPSPAPSNTGLTPAAYDWSVKSPSEPCAAPPAAQTRQPYFDYPAAAAMLPTPQEEASAHVFSPPMGSPYDERPTYVAPAFAACPLTPPEEHFVPTSRSIACPPIQEVYSQRPTLVHYNSAPFVQQTAPFAVQSAMMPLMVERSWALQQSRHASIHTLVSPDPSAPPSPTVPRGLSLPETTPLVAPIPTRPPQNCEFLTHHPTPRNSWDGTAAAYAVRPPRDEILAPAPVPSWDAVLADDEVDSSACYTESWVDTQNRQPLADYFSKYQQVW